MDYQKLVCWGDSQTVGARTYGCYPVHLVKQLNDRTRYRWSVQNRSTNGHTARDLWFRLGKETAQLSDVFSACILIGTNDVATGTPVELFREYYSQILDTLEMYEFKAVHCGEIPRGYPDGHAFFPRATAERRDEYNQQIVDLVSSRPSVNMVTFADLDTSCFVDPAHLSEHGNEIVASAFARSIMSF